LLLADADVSRILRPAEIERAFDLDEKFRHVGHIFERVFGVSRNEQAARDGEATGTARAMEKV
jgi:hypothetical protein